MGAAAPPAPSQIATKGADGGAAEALGAAVPPAPSQIATKGADGGAAEALGGRLASMVAAATRAHAGVSGPRSEVLVMAH